TSATDEGKLLLVRTATSRPIAPAGAQRSASDLDVPVARLLDCLLITGGDAVTAELGRGIVHLENCAIASGRDAFVLRPQDVSRHAFLADLWLDRCTIASEQNFIHLGPSLREEPGPDRPWLVSTRQCAFFDAYDRGDTPRSGVLLRADDAA